MEFIEEIFIHFHSNPKDEMQMQIWTKWEESLRITGYDKVENLSDFNLAFLSLLIEKYDTIIRPLVVHYVKLEFEQWYEEELDPNLISINSFNLRDLRNGKWEILFEDDQEDLIVHLIMNNWDYETTVKTG